jgi:hypothetical protein
MPFGNPHSFYVMVQAEDPADLSWEGMHLTSEACITWVKTTPFRLILYFLAESENGLVCHDSVEPAESDPEPDEPGLSRQLSVVLPEIDAPVP